MEDVPISMDVYGWLMQNNWRSFRKVFFIRQMLCYFKSEAIENTIVMNEPEKIVPVGTLFTAE